MVHSLVAILCHMIQITCTEPEDQRVYFMVWKPFRPSLLPLPGKMRIFFPPRALFLPLFPLLFHIFTLIFSVFVPRFFYSFFPPPMKRRYLLLKKVPYPLLLYFMLMHIFTLLFSIFLLSFIFSFFHLFLFFLQFSVFLFSFPPSSLFYIFLHFVFPFLIFPFKWHWRYIFWVVKWGGGGHDGVRCGFHTCLIVLYILRKDLYSTFLPV